MDTRTLMEEVEFLQHQRIIPVDCAICSQKTTKANVLVDAKAFCRLNRIDSIRVVCKGCTRGTNEHNIWEYDWLTSRPTKLLRWVLDGLTGGNAPIWSREAVEAFYGLLRHANPTWR